MERLRVSVTCLDDSGGFSGQARANTLLHLLPRPWQLDHKDLTRSAMDWPAQATTVELVKASVAACINSYNAPSSPSVIQGNMNRQLDGRSITCNGKAYVLPGESLNSSPLLCAASCITRIAQDEGLDLDSAEKRLDHILRDARLELPREALAILIRPALLPGVDEQKALDHRVRSELQSLGLIGGGGGEGTSQQQQQQPDRGAILLWHALERFIRHGRFHAVIERTAGQTLFETLGEITTILRRATGTDRLVFPSLLENLTVCIAFGGMSESGRSTIAAQVVRRARNLPDCEAVRLTISYLLELAGAAAGGRNVHDALPHSQQAVEIIHALDTYSRFHPWVKVITLESLHHYERTKWLKRLFGRGVPGETSSTSSFTPAGTSKCVVVYLDATTKTRTARAYASGRQAEHAKKDELMRSRGADKVRELADLTVDNNGGVDEAAKKVMDVVFRARSVK